MTITRTESKFTGSTLLLLLLLCCFVFPGIIYYIIKREKFTYTE